MEMELGQHEVYRGRRAGDAGERQKEGEAGLGKPQDDSRDLTLVTEKRGGSRTGQSVGQTHGKPSGNCE